MHLMIFYPGGVSSGYSFDDTPEEIHDVMYKAATIEEGNGDGKVKKRQRPGMDDRSRK